MYIVIAVAIAAIAGIYSLFSRRLEDARQQLLKFEAELHVLKHEMAHRDMEIKKHLLKVRRWRMTLHTPGMCMLENV